MSLVTRGLGLNTSQYSSLSAFGLGLSAVALMGAFVGITWDLIKTFNGTAIASFKKFGA